jgi:alcohol dehydrogenase class IV
MRVGNAAMKFDFATAGRIVFGWGAAGQIAAIAGEYGSRALIVLGTPKRVGGLDGPVLEVTGEPTVELVRQGVELARTASCEVVVAVGGGSAIDAGKAIAVLAGNEGDVLDYLEVIGRGKALTAGLPFVAAPTTAGTGSEVTRNAVLASAEQRVKASLRSPHMLAKAAVVDPELAVSMPPAITACTGMDALTQVIEPYVSVRANAMTDLFCIEGMRLAARSLEAACRDGGNREARTDMSMASLLGGLSLANAGLGAVHGFAAPLGGMFEAPHGAVCAALLPYVMAENIRALRERAPGGEALRRYERVARILTGRLEARAEDGVEWVARLREALRIPRLAEFGVTAPDAGVVVEKAAQASSMKGNPVSLSQDELVRILSQAL